MNYFFRRKMLFQQPRVAADSVEVMSQMKFVNFVDLESLHREAWQGNMKKVIQLAIYVYKVSTES